MGKNYPSANYRRGVSIIDQTSKDEFLISGVSQEDIKLSEHISTTKSRVWVLKINGEGNIIWEKELDNQRSRSVYSLLQANNGKGTVLVGSSNDFNNYNTGTKGFVMQIDNDGNVNWQKDFSYEKYTHATNILRDNNSDDYLVIGESSETLRRIHSNSFLAKLTENGNVDSWH